MWTALTSLVNTTISELEVFMKRYPFTPDFTAWHDVDEFTRCPEIMNEKHKVVAECARYFKEHPEQLDRWAELYKE